MGPKHADYERTPTIGDLFQELMEIFASKPSADVNMQESGAQMTADTPPPPPAAPVPETSKGFTTLPPAAPVPGSIASTELNTVTPTVPTPTQSDCIVTEAEKNTMKTYIGELKQHVDEIPKDKKNIGKINIDDLIAFISRDDLIDKIICYRNILYAVGPSITEKLKKLAGELFIDIGEQTSKVDLSKELVNIINNVKPIKDVLKTLVPILIGDTDFVPLPNELKRLLKIISHLVTKLTGLTLKCNVDTGIKARLAAAAAKLGYPLVSKPIKIIPQVETLIGLLKLLKLEPLEPLINIALCEIEHEIKDVSLTEFAKLYAANINKPNLDTLATLLHEIVLCHGDTASAPTCPTREELLKSVLHDLPPVPSALSSGLPGALPTALPSVPTALPGALPTALPSVPTALSSALPGALPTALPTALLSVPTALSSALPGALPGQGQGGGKTKRKRTVKKQKRRTRKAKTVKKKTATRKRRS